LPVFLDSPMAISATKLLCQFHNEHRLPKGLCADVCGVATYVNTVDDSKRLEQLRVPSVIISASGMATGGRILHHLKYFMGDPRNTILFTGFQAGGTRGDRMLKGETEIKIHGQFYSVKARVENLSSLSAHADYEGILKWLRGFKNPPKKTFITHGELAASVSLKEKIEKELGWDVVIPRYLDSQELS